MEELITLGLVETNSIAKGIEACDAMCKISSIKLVSAYPVCPGKYVIIIYGDVAAVEEAVDKGSYIASVQAVDKIVIPHIHPEIIPALLGTTDIKEIGSVGVIETFSIASGIKAADFAIKAAAVKLIEIRIAKGLGGKAFLTLTGTLSAVNAAVEAGVSAIEKDGSLFSKSIIPEPHEFLKKQLQEW